MALKHVVLLNGYSLAEHPGLAGIKNQKGEGVSGKSGDWEHVCLGTKEYPGRIPTVVQLARSLNATHLIWSTGATWKEEMSEARFCYQMAFGDRNSSPYLDEYEVENGWLESISLFEERSTNTSGTMIEVKKVLEERFADERIMLHLVSSANHMPRVMRDAIKVFDKMPNIILSGVPAGTSYGGKTPSDVVIYELGEPAKGV